MKHLRTYIVLSIVLLANHVHAQQEPMYSQYFFNNTIINPAQAGALGSNEVGALVRTQWVGIDGAPQTISAYGNFILPKQLGLAVGLYQDKVGVEINQHFQADLSYHLTINEIWNISGGLRMIASHYKADFSQIPNVDPNNPAFTENYSSNLLVNAGFGFLAYSRKTFIGLSMPKVYSRYMGTSNLGDLEFQRNKSLNLFIYGGTNIYFSEDFLLTPSALIRRSDAPMQIDVNAILGYKIFSFGPIFRMNFVEENGGFDSMGFLFGVRLLDEKLHFGYIYEYPLSDLNLSTVQTHEISLRYLFKFRGDNPLLVSPRYFH
jgi:type IX secretion system PorP/SprF family membrane protein